jgi:hypothetical protein
MGHFKVTLFVDDLNNFGAKMSACELYTEGKMLENLVGFFILIISKIFFLKNIP